MICVRVRIDAVLINCWLVEMRHHQYVDMEHAYVRLKRQTADRYICKHIHQTAVRSI